MQPHTVLIIQARMNSSRLPGKVLMDIAGETMLGRVIQRAARASAIHQIVVATTTNPDDDVIVIECERLKVNCIRGAENDVLDRYYYTARKTHARIIVRITADCPLIDPELIDQVIHAFHIQHVDYASNTQIRAWPRGLDVEVFTREALERAWNAAQETWQRAHVTPYIYQHPEIFRLYALPSAENHSAWRWTVDTPADLALIRAIYRHLAENDGWRAALAIVTQNPDLAEINQHIRQKILTDG